MRTKQKGISLTGLVVVLVILFAMVSLGFVYFGTSLSLRAKQLEKDINARIVSDIDPDIYRDRAKKELDKASEEVQKAYVEAELAKFELKEREVYVKSLKNEITSKILAFNRGKKFLNSHGPEEKYSNKKGKSYSYKQVVAKTKNLVTQIARLKKRVAMISSRNHDLRNAIKKREELITQKAIEIDSNRNKLKGDIAELKMLKEINKMKVSLGDSVLSDLEIPVFNAINKQLLTERAKAKYHNSLGDTQDTASNFLEEEDTMSDLETINKFSETLN